jgi:hypothetical protein
MQATICLLSERKEENSFLTSPLIGLLDRGRYLKGTEPLRLPGVSTRNTDHDAALSGALPNTPLRITFSRTLIASVSSTPPLAIAALALKAVPRLNALKAMP